MEELDFLLILCPPWDSTGPPLGSGYVIESLKSEGFSAGFVDLNALLFKEAATQPRLQAKLASITGSSDPHALWSVSSMLEWHLNKKISEDIFSALWPVAKGFLDPYLQRTPKMLGFSVYLDNIPFSVRTAIALRDLVKNAPIIFGGPWLNDDLYKRELRQSPVDMLVFGEAEEILPKILHGILSEPAQNRRRALKKMFGYELKPRTIDVNRIPYPKYEGFNLEPYQPNYAFVTTSRGCLNRCKFCADWVMSRRYRERALSNVFDELEFLTRTLGTKVIAFNDLNLASNVTLLKAIAQGIIDRKIEMQWDINLAISEGLDEDTFKLLADSGVRNARFGVETGSAKILKLMGKKYSPNLARRVLKASHAAGLNTMINIIVGYPNETEEDFEETVNFLKDVAEYLTSIASISTLCIFPQTYLARHLKRFAIQPICGNSAIELNWQQEGLDLKTRVERAYRLLAISGELNINLVRNIADINRQSLRHYTGRCDFSPLPISVTSGNMTRVGPFEFKIVPQNKEVTVGLRLSPGYSAIKHDGRLTMLEAGIQSNKEIMVQARELIFTHPVGQRLNEIKFRAKPLKELVFSIRRRELEPIELKIEALDKTPTAVIARAVGNPIFRASAQKNGGLSIELSERLVKLFWQNLSITSFPHVWFDFDTACGERFHSFYGEWTYEHKGKDGVLRAYTTWERVDFRFLNEFKLANDLISWKLYLETEKRLKLRRFKSGIALIEEYNLVGTEEKKFRLEKGEFSSWTVVGPRDDAGRMPLDSKFKGQAELLFASSTVAALPKIEVRSLSSNASLPVIQNGCDTGAALGFYGHELKIERGNTLIMELEIKAGGKTSSPTKTSQISPS